MIGESETRIGVAMRHKMMVPLQLLVRTEPPTDSPEMGDMYFDSVLGSVQVWDGERWGGLQGGSDEVVIDPDDPALQPDMEGAELWVDTETDGTGGVGIFLPLSGGRLGGSLVVDPNDPLDSGIVVEGGGIVVQSGGIRMSSAQITGPDSVVTKGYVDSLIGGGGGTGGLTIEQADARYVGKAEADGKYVNSTGDTMTGDLLVNGRKVIAYSLESMTGIKAGGRITNVGTPTAGTDAATKEYVDSVSGSGSPTSGMTQAQADARFVNLDGDTMTGPLKITHNSFTGYALEATDAEISNGISVLDGGVTIESDWLTINSGNYGGAVIYGAFEVLHETDAMPNRAIGFWRKVSGGASFQPLMAEEDHEPVTKAYLDATVATVDSRIDAAESRIWSGTQAQYDAISAKNPDVLYVIVG